MAEEAQGAIIPSPTDLSQPESRSFTDLAELALTVSYGLRKQISQRREPLPGIRVNTSVGELYFVPIDNEAPPQITQTPILKKIQQALGLGTLGPSEDKEQLLVGLALPDGLRAFAFCERSLLNVTAAENRETGIASATDDGALSTMRLFVEGEMSDIQSYQEALGKALEEALAQTKSRQSSASQNPRPMPLDVDHIRALLSSPPSQGEEQLVEILPQGTQPPQRPFLVELEDGKTWQIYFFEIVRKFVKVLPHHHEVFQALKEDRAIAFPIMEIDRDQNAVVLLTHHLPLDKRQLPPEIMLYYYQIGNNIPTK